MLNHEFANFGIRPLFPALNSADWAWGRAGRRSWLYGREIDGEPLFVGASKRGKDWISCLRGFYPETMRGFFASSSMSGNLPDAKGMNGVRGTSFNLPK